MKKSDSMSTKPKTDLTDYIVSKATAPGRYFDDQKKGFCLRVDQSGRKTFLYITKTKQTIVKSEDGKTVLHVYPRKNITVTIGQFPEYKVKEARDRTKQYDILIGKGINPNTESKNQRAANRQAEQQALLEQRSKSMTLTAALEEYISYKASPTGKPSEKKTKNTLSAHTISSYRLTMGKHLKSWLDRPLSEITGEMCDKRYREIAQTSLSSANGAFRGLRAVCNHVIDYYDGTIIEKNPVRKVSWEDLEPREKRISDTDLPAWWAAVQKLENPVYADYFMMLLLTGLRKDEAATMLWENVNFKEKSWTVKNTKNGRNHSLPFTKSVEQLLKRRYEARTNEFVFPSSSKSGHVFDTRYQQQQVTALCGVVFDNHMLRKTFATAAAPLVSELYVKRFLNHHEKSNVTQAHYIHLDELASLQGPLQKIENSLLSISKGKTLSKVK